MAADDDVDVRLRLRGHRQFKSDADQAARSVRGIGTAGTTAAAGASRHERATGRQRRGLLLLKTAAATAAIALGVGLVAGAKGAFAGFQESQAVAAETVNVLRSTGHAANVTAKDVAGLASSLSMKTGIDDEALQTGNNLLLTFTRIRNEVGKGNDIFDQASVAAANVSVRFKKDLNASAIMVGKALNDPIKGLTTLGRVGVQFTDQQKEQIKALVASGDTLGAQKIILSELNTQTKGAAVTQGKTLTGAINKAKVAWGNLGETVAGKVAPHLTVAATAVAGFITQMQTGEGAGGTFVAILADVGGVLGDVFGAGVAVVGVIVSLVKGFSDGKLGATLLVTAVVALTAAFVAYKVAVLVLRGVLVAATAAQALLNLTMVANPIGLVIAALVAIGVAFIVAYKKIGWFRAGVNAVWSFVKKHWPLILSILTGPIGAAVIFIIRNWDKVKGAVSSVVSFVRSKLNGLVGFITGLPGRIGKAASGMFRGIGEAFKSVVNIIVDFWNGLEFRIPGFDPPGPGPKFGGFTLGLPNLPRLAAGGIFATSGAAIVGDDGPEIARFPRGARVDPLPAGTDGGGVLDALAAKFDIRVYLGGRDITRQVAIDVRNAEARA